MKEEEGKFVYEYDIRDENSRDWDVECDASSATIIETEEEVYGTQHEKFLSIMKVG